MGPLPVGQLLTIVFNVVWKLFDTMFLGGLQAFIFALLTVLYFGMARRGRGTTSTTLRGRNQRRRTRSRSRRTDPRQQEAERR